MDKRKFIYDFVFAIFQIIILGLFFWFITTQVLVPRTDITVKCEGIINHSEEYISNLKSVNITNPDYYRYVLLNFTNNADFAGEDFNFILLNTDFFYIDTYGVGYEDKLQCDTVENMFNWAYFNCDYIPPQSSIELHLLPFYDNFEILYWSKTTPKTKVNVSCGKL